MDSPSVCLIGHILTTLAWLVQHSQQARLDSQYLAAMAHLGCTEAYVRGQDGDPSELKAARSRPKFLGSEGAHRAGRPHEDL